MTRFLVESDPQAFRDQAAPLLNADPVLHTLPLTVLGAICRGSYEEFLLGRVATSDGPVPAVGVMTPPYNLIVAASDRGAISTLAAGIAEQRWQLPGVTGCVPWVADFATAWSALTGVHVVEDKAERLFRLDTLVPPRPTAGNARPATMQDADLLTEWLIRFLVEVDLNDPLNCREVTVRSIEDGRRYVWEVEGTVVSDVGHNLEVGGQVRVGPVYTLPQLRGRGYASNLVSHVTALLLGRSLVPTLFTDLANPTSNGIYRALGYEPVADAFMLDFADPA